MQIDNRLSDKTVDNKDRIMTHHFKVIEIYYELTFQVKKEFGRSKHINIFDCKLIYNTISTDKEACYDRVLITKKDSMNMQATTVACY